MRILICAPFETDAAKGNSVAAARLAAGFRRRGDTVVSLGYPQVDTEADIAACAAALQPDAVLVLHAWRCAAVVRVLGLWGQAPIVVSLRGTDLNEMLGQGERGQQIAQSLHQADAIVVFHEAARQRLAAHDPAWAAKTHRIPNGVELPASDVDYRQRLGIPADGVAVVAVAGLREVKRVLWPVPLLERLRADGTDLYWLHAGPRLELEPSQHLDALLAQHGWLRHTDQVPHAEIDSFLRAGEVFVSASRSEGMPHAVREAMLAQRALLLSDIEGHRNLALAELEALFFTDENSFLQQATRLLAGPALRRALGAAARARVLADLEQHDEIEAHRNLFLSLRKRWQRDAP